MKFHTYFTAKEVTGMGNYAQANDYKRYNFTFDADASSTATVKFQGSFSEIAPDFTAAQSSTNQWDYLDVIDLQDGASINGNTGIAVSATTDHRMVQVNINGGLTFVNAIITAITGGSVTVKGTLSKI